MNPIVSKLLIAVVALAVILAVLFGAMVFTWSQFPRAAASFFLGVNTGPVPLSVAARFDQRSADTKTRAIVSRAQVFLGSLDNEQRDAASYEFSDNAQRSNWSNLPEGMIPRGGLMLGTLSAAQRGNLDDLLAEIMSEKGFLNTAYQLAAEDTLPPGGFAKYGTEFYYVAFLGEPSESQPWMFQFGGHHLALNVTVYGADVTFSPMLTGGQPLNFQFDGNNVFITEEETRAAQRLLDSLTPEQQSVAIRGPQPIDLLLGPGEFGTVVAPEGIPGAQLTEDQKPLLVALIDSRLDFINEDDNAAAMARVLSDLDETYFAWWGSPTAKLGFAYFRVTGPTLVLEYAPQDVDESPSVTDHAHSMYRDPTNDYGSAWVAP